MHAARTYAHVRMRPLSKDLIEAEGEGRLASNSSSKTPMLPAAFN